MIGLVIVSHSPRLAEAAVDLALQMVPGEPPPLVVAAGAGDQVIGTDAVRVQAAIEQLAHTEGVLVLMDLGSAVLSAELALDLLGEPPVPVVLSPAPFVEGLIAAVVRAAAGATLDETAREARGALGGKAQQLGADIPGPDTAGSLDPGVAGEPPHGNGGPGETEPVLSEEVRLVNPTGLHARPAAALASAAASFDARVTVRNTSTGRGPAEAVSPIGLAGLGGVRGDVLRIEASGVEAAEALSRVAALIAAGFDETGSADTAPEAETGGTGREASAEEPPRVDRAAAEPSRNSVDPAGPRVPDSAETLSGRGISPGRARGPVLRMPAPPQRPAPSASLPEAAREAETARLAAAAEHVAESLRERAAAVDGPGSEVLGATALLAADPGALEQASRRVLDEGETAALAAWEAFTSAAELFAARGGLLAERAADVRDVRHRIVAELQGSAPPGVPAQGRPGVLLAGELAPADAALLDPAHCLALVMETGGSTSHTAIIVRSLGIPAVAGLPDVEAIPDGAIVEVDGTEGTVVVDRAPRP